MGEPGTWVLNGYDPEGRPIEFTARWDATVGTNTAGAVFPYNNNSNTFTTSFNAPATYTLRFRIQDEVGKSAETSTTVRVSN